MKYSVVNFSEVQTSPGFRVDAEYWHPSFIANSQLVSEKRKVGDFVRRDVKNITSSPLNKDFEYLEISNISMHSIQYQTTTVEHGSEPDRARHIMKRGDIAVSTVRPNRNAVAFIQNDGIIGSSGLTILRAENIEPEYLFAFCKTEYFINCLVRANRATMYPAVSQDDVLNTPLFLPSNELRSAIVEVVNNSLSCILKMEKIFEEVQDILLSELGLANWVAKHCLWYVKNYSDTQQASRFDAEYFQPKYDEIVNVIKSYPCGWDTLGNLATLKDTNFVPVDKTFYQYIELSHIANNGEVAGCMNEAGENLPTRARRQVLSGDVIVSSVEGSLESIGMIDDEYNHALCSTGFHVINSAVLNPETLLVFLKSVVGQLQLKKGCSGAILCAINKPEFLKIVLPKVSQKVQSRVQRQVTSSLVLRNRSKHLLNCAKHATEIAITKNENEALRWLKENSKI